ncbi:MAG: hypothetical protein KDD45_16915 [Bdellovibrionales bacterium]|nr:hypothetical protein [Bdellovibrionales bacterium]
MKLFKFISLIFISSSAFAGLQVGTYTGATANNQTCSFTVEKRYFENNLQHPLNERIAVKVGSIAFTLQHPPVIDVASSYAAYNHDMFQAINATSVGAQALVILMKHPSRGGDEIPGEFHFINHEYKANKKEKVSCFNLKFSTLRGRF